MAFPTDPIYKLVKNPMTGTVNAVKKQIGIHGTVIPFNEDNREYREYLEWKEKGNTAEAAD